MGIVRFPCRALCDDRAAGGEHGGAPVALRVGVGERPADGAAVANERVGDKPGGGAEHAVASLQEG